MRLPLGAGWRAAVPFQVQGPWARLGPWLYSGGGRCSGLWRGGNNSRLWCTPNLILLWLLVIKTLLRMCFICFYGAFEVIKGDYLTDHQLGVHWLSRVASSSGCGSAMAIQGVIVPLLFFFLACKVFVRVVQLKSTKRVQIIENLFCALFLSICFALFCYRYRYFLHSC